MMGYQTYRGFDRRRVRGRRHDFTIYLPIEDVDTGDITFMPVGTAESHEIADRFLTNEPEGMVRDEVTDEIYLKPRIN